MRINERRVGEVIVLDFVGPVAGWKDADAVVKTLARHGRSGPRTVVVNLGGVPSVDLAGLGALVDGYRAMRKVGSEMRLACLTRRIHDLIVITRLLTVFDTFESVEQAIEGPVPAYAGVAAPQPSSATLVGIQRFLRRA